MFHEATTEAPTTLVPVPVCPDGFDVMEYSAGVTSFAMLLSDGTSADACLKGSGGVAIIRDRRAVLSIYRTSGPLSFTLLSYQMSVSGVQYVEITITTLEGPSVLMVS